MTTSVSAGRSGTCPLLSGNVDPIQPRGPRLERLLDHLLDPLVDVRLFETPERRSVRILFRLGLMLNR